MRPRPDPVRPGQRSVWDFPRPPRVEPSARALVVVFGGEVIARSTRGFAVLETSHPPTYYLPPEDVRMDCLRPCSGGSSCEFKGEARYFDVVVGERRAERAAWSYPIPADPRMAHHVAFYAGPMDRCTVDGERVVPQPGGFYGGWITSDLAGPFKGGPGTRGW